MNRSISIICRSLLIVCWLSATRTSAETMRIWRVVSVSEYYSGDPIKPELHNTEAKLPLCDVNASKRGFVSEVCTALKPADLQDTTSVGFQYCDCPEQWPCSRDESDDDPYTYAIIDDLHLKTCLPKSHIPVCPVYRKRRRGSVVAKIWYGEEMPQRVLTHCRCPKGFVWGQLKCTSSGRICYVTQCEKI